MTEHTPLPEISGCLGIYCQLERPTLLARIRELEDALIWALAEVDGRTNYYNPFQRSACLKRAKAAIVNSHTGARLCSDCPPEGYPTDETRCEECPRSTQR